MREQLINIGEMERVLRERSASLEVYRYLLMLIAWGGQEFLMICWIFLHLAEMKAIGWPSDRKAASSIRTRRRE